MDDRHSEPIGSLRDGPRSTRIDCESEVLLGLGLVDGGIGSGRDDDLWACLFHRTDDRLFVTDKVELRPTEGNDVVPRSYASFRQ
jgi:hypothetical protein